MVTDTPADPGQRSLEGPDTPHQPHPGSILNLMDLIPVRTRDHIQQGWQVGFREPRFRSRFWNRFFMALGSSEHLIVRLDRLGSEIYGYIDGERNVRRILSLLEMGHPGEKGLRERFVSYLKRLEHHGFIELTVKGGTVENGCHGTPPDGDHSQGN